MYNLYNLKVNTYNMYNLIKSEKTLKNRLEYSFNYSFEGKTS